MATEFDKIREVYEELKKGEFFFFVESGEELLIGVRMSLDEDNDEYVIFQCDEYHKVAEGVINKIKEAKE